MADSKIFPIKNTFLRKLPVFVFSLTFLSVCWFVLLSSKFYRYFSQTLKLPFPVMLFCVPSNTRQVRCRPARKYLLMWLLLYVAKSLPEPDVFYDFTGDVPQACFPNKSDNFISGNWWFVREW